MAETGRSRRIQVAAESRAAGLLDSRWQELPPGVELTPRRLTVEYSSPEEFLEKVGAIIFALQNDYEAIREAIEAGEQAPRGQWPTAR